MCVCVCTLKITAHPTSSMNVPLCPFPFHTAHECTQNWCCGQQSNGSSHYANGRAQEGDSRNQKWRRRVAELVQSITYIQHSLMASSLYIYRKLESIILYNKTRDRCRHFLTYVYKHTIHIYNYDNVVIICINLTYVVKLTFVRSHLHHTTSLSMSTTMRMLGTVSLVSVQTVLVACI